MTTQRYTLGDQGKRGRRVWLDSATLLNNAGFTRGASYTKTFISADGYVNGAFSQNIIVLDRQNPYGFKTFKVSGKGANPVIEITSKKVSKHFAGYDFISVEFSQGRIIIQGSA